MNNISLTKKYYTVFIDESKPHPEINDRFWLCGLVIQNDKILEISHSIENHMQTYLKNEEIKVEIKGCDIVQGNGLYKGRCQNRRIDLYKDLLDIIAEKKHSIMPIDISIDINKFYGKKKTEQDWALMFMVERVDQLMQTLSAQATLVADMDKEFSSQNIRKVKGYIRHGTGGHRGQEINNIVDSITYVDSRSDNLLQLTDIYTYVSMLKCNKKNRRLSYAKKQVVGHFDMLNIWPMKYRHWP